MPGRRWSDGLHQAIEAKEGVTVQQETVTLATITFQNFFRLYDKLAGMTGTALTEAEEFHKIYKLEVVPIPTHRPMVRLDEPDLEAGAVYQMYDRQMERLSQIDEAYDLVACVGRPRAAVEQRIARHQCDRPAIQAAEPGDDRPAEVARHLEKAALVR